MRSLTATRTRRKRLRHAAVCSILFTTAITLGFTATSGAQEVEGLTEDQKLESSTAELFDAGFGHSVAVDDDTMVVGAPFDGGNGAAYVFESTPSGWVETERLVSDDLELVDGDTIGFGLGAQFGFSVAIDGDTIIVGAPTAQNLPNQAIVTEFGLADCCPLVDAGFLGAAYVFERDGSDWTETQRLTDTDFLSLNDDDDFFLPSSTGFGHAVAIDGDTIAVGAPISGFFDFRATGVTLPSFRSGNGGTAYVYVQAGQEWESQQPLTGFDFSPLVGFGEVGPVVDLSIEDLFGYSLAIDGDTIVVGAPLGRESLIIDDIAVAEARPGINLQFPFLELPPNGTAHVFSFDGDEWNEDQRLSGDEDDFDFDEEFFDFDFDDDIDDIDIRAFGGIGVFGAGDQFGYSVAIDADTIVVGALLEDGETLDEGAAYVFADSDGTWIDVETLTPLVSEPEARFGRSVAIDGDDIVAGSPFANDLAGAAYLFSIDGEGGIDEVELIASDVEAGEGFGFAVALSDGTAVSGAPLGIAPLPVLQELGGQILLDNGPGAAYVFDLSPEPPVFCNDEEVTVNLALGDEPTDGDDVILGTDGPDVINAGAGDDVICGEGGADTIVAGAGNDTVFGGDGADTIQASRGDDVVYGNGGDDVVRGGKGTDILNGGSGNDDLRGDKGKDTINGDSGNDKIRGDKGSDSIDGGSGSDELRGGQKDDVINGGNGRDLLVGGNGPDILDGGLGIDEYNGSGGDDNCVADPNGLTEIITNCEN